MLLACERPADQGGECLLIDGRTVHADLSARWREAVVMLSRPGTTFFGADNGHCTQVFMAHPGGRVSVRLRLDDLARWSPLVAPYISCVSEVITRHQHRLRLTPGQGYLLDNHRWLHARARFSGDRQCLRALGEPHTPLACGFAIDPAACALPVTSDAV